MVEVSDIMAGLDEFLQRDEPLDDDEREKGRQVVRKLISWRVAHGDFDKKHPRGPAAIYLEEVTFNTNQGLRATASAISLLLDVNVLSRDTDDVKGSYVGRQVSLGLLKMLGGYNGPLTDAIYAQTIKHRSGPSLLPQPAKDSTGWSYRFRSTYFVGVTESMPQGVR